MPDDGEEDIGEALPENKLTLDNLAEGFCLSKPVFDLFYDMDPSILWALKIKQMAEEGLVHTETFLEKQKSKQVQQKLQCISIKLAKHKKTIIRLIIIPFWNNGKSVKAERKVSLPWMGKNKIDG